MARPQTITGRGVTAIALSSLAAMSATATADPPPEGTTNAFTYFSLPATNGFTATLEIYRLTRISGSGPELFPSAAIQVSRQGSAGDFVGTYRKVGSVVREGSGYRVVFDFGRFGRVDGRLTPVGSVRTVSEGFFGELVCRRSVIRSQAIAFEGAVRFAGERRYTSVMRRQVRGVEHTFITPLCRRPRRPPETQVLMVQGASDGTRLNIIGAGQASIAYISASTQLGRRGPSVSRVVAVRGPRSAFTINARAGEARYAAPRGTRLSGLLSTTERTGAVDSTLRVSFPGLEPLRITGTTGSLSRTRNYALSPPRTKVPRQ